MDQEGRRKDCKVQEETFGFENIFIILILEMVSSQVEKPVKFCSLNIYLVKYIICQYTSIKLLRKKEKYN